MEIPKDLYAKLEKLAFNKSKPFCYGCYREVKPDEHGHAVCPTCFSDDLMRLVDGVGCEYGVDWVIEHLIKNNCEYIDTDNYIDEYFSDVYSDTVKICGIEFDQAWAFKTLDPIAYDMSKSEMISFNLGDGLWIEVNGEYYDSHDVEQLIEDNQ